MKDKGSQIAQHKRLAMGQDIGHAASKSPKQFKAGGVVKSHEYQKYGMGYRKVKAK